MSISRRQASNPSRSPSVCSARRDVPFNARVFGKRRKEIVELARNGGALFRFSRRLQNRCFLAKPSLTPPGFAQALAEAWKSPRSR